jgi:acyl-CoA thioesterase
MARTGQPARTAAHEMFDRDGASRGLGIELVSAGDGAGICLLRPTRFLRPARAGDVPEARAARRAVSGRSGIHGVILTCGGEVVAEFRGRSRVIGPGRPA